MAMTNRKCLRCEKPIRGHWNRLRCEPCARYLRQRPAGTMTKQQIRQAKAMAGKVRREEIANRLGVSVANLKRSLPDTSFAVTWIYKKNPTLVRKVCEYYFKHGMPKTIEHFPGVKVKCIVDRPEYYGIKRISRQQRWTEEQKIELAKMAGLISAGAQAKYFNRPRAAGGSIKAAWVKVFGMAPTRLNGMVHDLAQHVATKDTPYLHAMGSSRRGEGLAFRWVVLWVDLERHLRPDVPEYQRQAVKAMADFQRWLWNDKNPKPKILKMIREREV